MFTIKVNAALPGWGSKVPFTFFGERGRSVHTAQRQMPTQIHVGFCVNISVSVSVWMLYIFGVKNQHLEKNITSLEAFCRLLPACLLGVRLLFPYKDLFVFKLLPGQKQHFQKSGITTLHFFEKS